MSSFVIDKREYMKAAGMMHGIASSAKLPWEYFTENVKARFTRLYELNEKSVCEQYKRPFEGLDECEYQDVFDHYSSFGKSIWSNKEDTETRAKLRDQLINFFGCITYQIENHDMLNEARAFLYVCLETYLIKLNRDYIADSWGKITF